MYSHSNMLALVAALLASTASSHMIMASPKPFSNVQLDNSPLEASGANFPCKTNGSPDFFKATFEENKMAVGETQTLSFTGSAVHGGGSCQLAVTSDLAPTASSTWQVIMSIEGGCPGVSGPATFPWKIPEQVKPGKYVFGWTWISKLAGQPEFYMNCAPITVTGGSSKRDIDNATESSIEDLDKRADALPNLFVANLASVNSCKAGPAVVTYPEPGPNLVTGSGASAQGAVKPTGDNCFPKGGKSTPGASGGDAASASTIGSAAGAAATGASGSSGSGATSGGASSGGGDDGQYHPDTQGPNAQAGGAAGAAAGSAGASGAAAAPSASSSSTVATPIAPSAAPSAAPSVAPAPAGGADSGSPSSAADASPSAAAATSSPSVAAGVAAPSGAAAPSGSTGSTSSAGALTGPCTSEGMWNCIGGNSFQRCASGAWSAVTPMAGGTFCKPGQSTNFAAVRRRDGKFSSFRAPA